MKWIVCGICGVLLSVLLLCAPLFSSAAGDEYLRIHIRANSNSAEDQRVKYMVKDAVVEALIPLLADAQTKQQAEKMVCANFDYIEQVANKVLENQGFDYQSSARLDREQFPARSYDDITLPAGDYDAVIIDLGSGDGNNWWCLVYPAFCFTKTQNSTNYVYISKIWEIIESVKQN